MRADSRRAPTAGVVSVALVAVARAARDARPSRRVTCVRVPRVPVAPPSWDPAPAVAPAEAPAAVRAEPDVSATALAVPEVGATAPAVPEVSATALAAPEVSAAPVAEPEVNPTALALPEMSATVVVPEPLLFIAPALAPEPVAVPATEALVAVAYPAPDLAVAAPAPVDTAADPVTGEPAVDPPWGWAEPWSFELPTATTSSQRRRADASRRASRHARRRSPWRQPLIAFSLLMLAVGVWIAASWSPSASARSSGAGHASFTPHPSAFARQSIPVAYLHMYWRAAEEYGLNWAKLAAVGELESDHGRNPGPGVNQGTNYAGAAGPAQFIGSTWARYGVDADGRGTINPYDPADAITAMAAYLKASGAPQDWRQALHTYNHSTAYAQAVFSLSRRYIAARRAVLKRR